MVTDYIVYDCETQKYAEDPSVGGWHNVYGMEMSSAVTYDSKTDNYTFWDHLSRERLCEFLNGKLVISFNGIMFDSRLLLGNDRTIELNGMTRNIKYGWNNIDLYVEIFRRIFKMDKSNYPKIIETMQAKKHAKGVFGLHDVTIATLNHTKTGDGAEAPMLFKQGRIVELFQYNLQDVRVTKELFQFILKYKYLVTGSYDIVQFK
jgi:hypothetical protein